MRYYWYIYGGSFFIVKGPRIDPEEGYRVDVNEDRDDSPDVESSSVSSASSWNSTDEQMRKTLMKSEMVPVMLTIASSSGISMVPTFRMVEAEQSEEPTPEEAAEKERRDIYNWIYVCLKMERLQFNNNGLSSCSLPQIAILGSLFFARFHVLDSPFPQGFKRWIWVNYNNLMSGPSPGMMGHVRGNYPKCKGLSELRSFTQMNVFESRNLMARIRKQLNSLIAGKKIGMSSYPCFFTMCEFERSLGQGKLKCQLMIQVQSPTTQWLDLKTLGIAPLMFGGLKSHLTKELLVSTRNLHWLTYFLACLLACLPACLLAHQLR